MLISLSLWFPNWKKNIVIARLKMRSYLIIPDPQTSVSYVDRGGGIINKGQLASPWPVGAPVACLSCEGSSGFREVESRFRIIALDLD